MIDCWQRIFISYFKTYNRMNTNDWYQIEIIINLTECLKFYATH